jgi:hypothetical protein
MARFVKPAVPIVIVLLLLYAFNQAAKPTLFEAVVASVICGAILWFGWSWIRRNVVAKWIGILLTAYLALILGLFALGVVLAIGPLLGWLLLLALPFLVYDLFFRQPHKGRFARARAERRTLPYE